jgi:hypothetical protein
MPVYERLSMVVGFTLIGLALYFIIDLPTRLVNFEVFNRAITIAASQRLLMAVLLGGLALTGAGAVIRSYDRSTSYTVPFWVNAMFIVVLATLTLARLGSPLAWAIGLMLTGVLLWCAIYVEYYLLQGNTRYRTMAQLYSQWISYALMLAFGLLLYEARLSPVLNAGLVFFLAWLLSLSIFKLYASAGTGIAIFGFLTGLGLAQLTWVLSYWRISATGGGLLTLLIFYLLSGLIVTHLQNKITRRAVLEYILVGGTGLWIIVRFAY